MSARRPLAAPPRPLDVQTMSTSPDALVDALHALTSAVRELQADLRPRRAGTLARADRRVLSAVLPALVGVVGSEPFTVSEALEHDAVRLVVGARTAIQMGRLLRRATGVVIDGLVIERVGDEARRVLWRVVETI
jgi:hypothetical protein